MVFKDGVVPGSKFAEVIGRVNGDKSITAVRDPINALFFCILFTPLFVPCTPS